MTRKTGPRPEKGHKGASMLWRLIKILFLLGILAGLGLVAYAYVGPVVFPADFAAPSEEMRVPLTLETQD